MAASNTVTDDVIMSRIKHLISTEISVLHSNSMKSLASSTCFSVRFNENSEVAYFFGHPFFATSSGAIVAMLLCLINCRFSIIIIIYLFICRMHYNPLVHSRLYCRHRRYECNQHLTTPARGPQSNFISN